MHPLAEELNRTLERDSPAVLRLLSERGRRLFFPRGIITQSQEAKEKAHKANATIGIASDGKDPIFLECIHKYFKDIPPGELYPYAPSSGRADLRAAWLDKLREENPSMAGKTVSKPLVTAALTHGLSLVGDLFVDADDVILIPDKFWGNYRLIFEVRLGARLVTYPLYTQGGGFNVAALREALLARPPGSKTLVLLNFPNNPTGYSPTAAEGAQIAAALIDAAAGRDLLAVFDDAYFGLCYEDDCLKESLFAHVCDGHERLLAVKADAATKEEFVWGFRCGFLTYGVKGAPAGVYEALEKKTAGAIRGSISNASHVGQSVILRALRDPDFRRQQQAARAVLAQRACKVKEVASRSEFADVWDVYPFNSGYFMCLRIKGAGAEALRVHLLDRYQVGTISTGDEDLRVAFSSVPIEQIEEVFATIARGVRDLKNGG